MIILGVIGPTPKVTPAEWSDTVSRGDDKQHYEKVAS
jgi:hypothetical protein